MHKAKQAHLFNYFLALHTFAGFIGFLLTWLAVDLTRLRIYNRCVCLIHVEIILYNLSRRTQRFPFFAVA